LAPTFWFLIALIALAVWVLGAYFFWRIDLKGRERGSAGVVSPVLRLADQWLAESQKKIGDFAQRAEQPLGTAQNELLELRLEASRLPQGIKSLKLVRESLAVSQPAVLPPKSLLEITSLYLQGSDDVVGEGSLARLKTPLGVMPCLEVEVQSGGLTEAGMKGLLLTLSRALDTSSSTASAGALLYFRDEKDFQACLANPEWMAGLKSRQWMAVDRKGLTALLVALRLSQDVDRVLQVFAQGIETARPLTGQSDRMNDALSTLSAHSLVIRTMLEGNAPNDLKILP